jgi:hypothetical protein
MSDERSNLERMYKTLDSLRTPAKFLAKYNLFIYSMLFNREIEPSFNYADKFFTILSHKFQEFVKSDTDLFLLEASPRTGKTDFVINILLIWLLGNKEKNNFLIVVSTQKLKKDLRRKIERVVKTKIFSEIFGNISIVTANDGEIILTNGNVVTFTTTKSSIPIGAGFHWHFYIDFLNSETMRSQPIRDEAFSQLTNFLTRTQHNPATKVVVDNQRLGTEDLSAYFVEQYAETGLPMERLTFPYQFQDDYHFDINGKLISFKQGEYLVSRFNDNEKKKILARQGAFIYETQYLQKPRKARGDLVKREMFKYYSDYDLKNINFVKGFITTDLALEDKRFNDYNVFCFWLVDDDQNLYLIDMQRLKIKGIQAETALYHFYLKWKDGLRNGGVGCNAIHFENTTNTKMTIQRYRNGLDVEQFVNGQKVKKKVVLAGLVVELTRVKNKFSRFIDALPHIEGGKLYLPGSDVKINGIANVRDEIIEPLISECENFREDDTHDHDDIIDNVIDGIIEARTHEISLAVGF